MTESSAVTDLPGDGLLTPEQVATALGVNKRTVLRWVENDEISHVRYGKVIRIPRSALEAKEAS